MVTHVLKDGRVLKDISGHKVKKEECPMIYEIIGRRAERSRNELRGIKKGK